MKSATTEASTMADERERQTSNKSGVKSTAKKMENSRHGFDEHPASRKTAGAFGHEEKIRGSRESSRGSTRPAKTETLTKMKKSS
jgi:hypothetical protein